ncbi:hypothetical protein [Bdellovibrio sp. HCB337]|uniref:hypothetical protein n=1 Tax=Bdellovibrio sp. HCB337 TaxID=3394358 RepID=UPI0039A75CB7
MFAKFATTAMLGLFLTTPVVFAKGKTEGATAYKPMDAAPADNFEAPTTEHLDKVASWRIKGSASRNISSASGSMSSEYQALVQRVNTMKTAQELDTYLETLEKDLKASKEKPADYVYVATLLTSLRPLRSIAWRSMGLAGQSVATQQKIMDTLRSAYTKSTVLPVENWDLFVDFVSQPLPGATQKFTQESELQKYIATEVYNGVAASYNRLSTVDFGKIPGNSIVWDQQLNFGSTSFPDQLDRYREITPVEHALLLARMNKLMYRIATFSAYSAKDAIKIEREIKLRYGVEAGASWLHLVKSDGLTRQEKVNIIQQKKYAQSQTLNAAGKMWMGRAYQHLKGYVDYYETAYKLSKNSSRSQASFVDVEFVKLHDRELSLMVKNMKALVYGDNRETGESVVQSSITGETARVNVKNFFANPPQDLKTLLPTSFDQGPKEIKAEVDGKNLSYPNLRNGQAQAWSTQAYSNLFPELKNDSQGTKVLQKAKVISGVRGGDSVLGQFIHPFVK